LVHFLFGSTLRPLLPVAAEHTTGQ
jgi:hypothetical protein